MEKALSTFGLQATEGGTMTLVPQMASPPAYTPLLWAQLTKLGGRLNMMKTVQGKWLSLSASTQTHSQDQMTLGNHIIKL